MAGLVTVKLVLMLTNVKMAPMNAVPMVHAPTTTAVMTALATMASVVMDLTAQISMNAMTNHADSTPTASIPTEHSNVNVLLVTKVMQ